MKETLINTNSVHQKTLSKMLQKAQYKGLSFSKLEEVIDKTERGLEDYRTIYDTIFDESMENSSDYLGKVKEFMTTFGQPVLDKPTPLPEDRQKFRIALLFEELKEYAEASGQWEYFVDQLCEKEVDRLLNDRLEGFNQRPSINEVEQLDALLDLQYVLSGAVHEHGFGEIFNAGFNEVHASNMSKADDNREDAWITGDKYLLSEDEIRTRFEEINGKFVTYRQEDNKVLKSHKYKPAQLAQFLK